ncbi:hypothetical protein C8J57DRAFT_1561844 [Mycena rebaudengoi]|nr:hypothetical protein C8J57DRAFT_1561844 [Mycena rebaudengoi]
MPTPRTPCTVTTTTTRCALDLSLALLIHPQHGDFERDTPPATDHRPRRMLQGKSIYGWKSSVGVVLHLIRWALSEFGAFAASICGIQPTLNETLTIARSRWLRRGGVAGSRILRQRFWRLKNLRLGAAEFARPAAGSSKRGGRGVGKGLLLADWYLNTGSAASGALLLAIAVLQTRGAPSTNVDENAQVRRRLGQRHLRLPSPCRALVLLARGTRGGRRGTRFLSCTRAGIRRRVIRRGDTTYVVTGVFRCEVDAGRIGQGGARMSLRGLWIRPLRHGKYSTTTTTAAPAVRSVAASERATATPPQPRPIHIPYTMMQRNVMRLPWLLSGPRARYGARPAACTPTPAKRRRGERVRLGLDSRPTTDSHARGVLAAAARRGAASSPHVDPLPLGLAADCEASAFEPKLRPHACRRVWSRRGAGCEAASRTSNLATARLVEPHTRKARDLAIASMSCVSARALLACPVSSRNCGAACSHTRDRKPGWRARVHPACAACVSLARAHTHADFVASASGGLCWESLLRANGKRSVSMNETLYLSSVRVRSELCNGGKWRIFGFESRRVWDGYYQTIILKLRYRAGFPFTRLYFLSLYLKKRRG